MKQYLCSWKWRKSGHADCIFSPDITKARVWKIRTFAEAACEDLAAHTISVIAPDGSMFRCAELEIEEREGSDGFVVYCTALVN